MTKRDWFWTVVWLLLLIGAFGLVGKDDYEWEQREAAYYNSRQVEREEGIMSEYTPGPWYVKRNGIRTPVNSEDGRHIAMINYNPMIIPDEMHEANARLIAAAPELLEALKDLLELSIAPEETALDTFERVGEAFYIETGMLRPGKSEPPECDYEGRTEERRAAFDAWISKRLETARAAIAKAEDR